MTPPDVIRVFVSSTFKDMKEEREELVKRTFPELRKRCLARGVEFAAVDLRWGINEESEVLPICLDQIQRCSMFLGILGERHGSIPDVDDGMKDAEPWLLDYPEASLTEIEILRAALDGSTVKDAQFFYFRDAGYARSKGGDFLPADPAERDRVEKLKQRIESGSLPVRDRPYRDPSELGAWVLEDLAAAIDRMLPAALESDPWGQENAKQAVLNSLLRGSHIGATKLLSRLDDLASVDGPPVLVAGPPGIGKSSMLAKWLARLDESDTPVVSHFVDAASVASWTHVVGRVARLLIAEFDLSIDIPEDEDGLRDLLAEVFSRIARGGGRCVLVLDGLDGMRADEGALELGWLPVVVPEGVTIVLSARSGETVAEVDRRGWRRLEVGSLTADERREIATDYLAQYGKTLTDNALLKVAETSANGNPRFLKTVLNELRQWGDYQSVDQEVERLTRAHGMYELFELVLKRLEVDFEHGADDLVTELMALLWAVPSGMSESELLELLGDGEPLPQSVFSPVFLSIEPLLSASGGTVRLSDPAMRDVVADRYLRDSEDRAALHSHVANYFFTLPRDERVVQVLPDQLMKAGREDAVFELLTDPEFFGMVYETSRLACSRLWASFDEPRFSLVSGADRLIAGIRQLPPEEAYAKLHILFYLADLLQKGGWMGLAADLWAFLTGQAEALNHKGALGRALQGQHQTLTEMGRVEEARAVLPRLLELIEDAASQHPGGRSTEASALGAEAARLAHQQRHDEALDLLDRQEDLLRGLGASRELAECYASKASILASKGWVEQAIHVLDVQERTLRDLGDKFTLQRSLNNKARLQIQLSRFDAASSSLDQQEQICRIIDNPAGLVDCLVTRASLFEAQGDETEAHNARLAALQLARERGLSDREQVLRSELESSSDRSGTNGFARKER